MNQITIDLQGIENKKRLLTILGAVFELGGSNGNVEVSSLEKKGWGMNWDALNDSLSYLDSGGIWGTSVLFEFPMNIVFHNSQALQANDQQSFQTLKGILQSKSDEYGRAQMIFAFEFL